LLDLATELSRVVNICATIDPPAGYCHHLDIVCLAEYKCNDTPTFQIPNYPE
jgi:hypothetical protein